MSIFLYTVLGILTLFFLGYGLSVLIIPVNLKKYSLWLMPWIATIFLIVFLVLLSFFGLSIAQSSPLLVSILIVLDLYVYFEKKPKIYFDVKQDLIILGIIILNVIFILYPLIKLVGFPSTISLGNNDVIAYAETADFLIQNSLQYAFYNTIPSGADNILLGAFRWGTSMIMSFFTYLFNFYAYEITYIIEVIYFSIMLPLVYILFQILYKKSYSGLILSLIITGFNVNLLYMLYHNFFPHIIFRSLLIFLLIFFIDYFYSYNKKSKEFSFNRYDIIIIFGLSAMYFSYQEVAIFFMAPIGLFLIFNLSKMQKLKDYWQKLLKIGSGLILVSLPSIIYSFIFLVNQLNSSNTLPNQPIGWQLFRAEIPYVNPFEMMGFYSIHYFPPLPILIAIITSLFVLTLILVGLIRSKFISLVASYLFTYFFLYLYMSIIKPNFFDYNRIVTYTLPLLIVLFSIGYVYLWNKNKFIRYLKIIGLFLILFMVFFNAKKLYNRVLSESLIVDNSFISLKNIQDKKPVIQDKLFTQFHLDTSLPYWDLVWTNYFLNLNKIPLELAPYDGRKVLDKSKILLIKQGGKRRSLDVLLAKIYWQDKYNIIGSLCNSDKCLEESSYNLSKIIFGESRYVDSLILNGWSTKETDFRWSNSLESRVRLVTKSDFIPSKLVIEAYSLSEPQKVEIYINENFIGEKKIASDWSIYSFDIPFYLDTGVQKIEFKFSNLYKPVDLGIGLDMRDLSVNFRKILLE